MLTFSRGQRGERRPVDLRRDRRGGGAAAALVDALDARARDAGRRGRAAHLARPRCRASRCCSTCASTRATRCRGTARSASASDGPRTAPRVCTSCRAAVRRRVRRAGGRRRRPGIPPEVMERMFEPFFSTKEVGKGSGMGLATVHGIVHEHGGHIVVESAPGRGATFRVLFPVLRADDEAIEHETLPGYVPAVAPGGAARPRAGGRRRGDGRRLHARAARGLGPGGHDEAQRTGRAADLRRRARPLRPGDHRPDDAADDRPGARARAARRSGPGCR